MFQGLRRWALLLYRITPVTDLNSLVPGKCGCNLKLVIFKLMLMINIMSINSKIIIVLRGMPQNLTDDWSTLVQEIALCHQAASHYLNQCWCRYMSPVHNELNSNLTKSRLFITAVSIVKSFCHALQNFKMIWQLSNNLWTNRNSIPEGRGLPKENLVRCNPYGLPSVRPNWDPPFR